MSFSQNINHVTIFTLTGTPLELDLILYLQKCTWARKPHRQQPHTYDHHGIANENIFYHAFLSSEEILYMKLKFGEKIKVIPFNKDNSSDANYKDCHNGESYYFSAEASLIRAIQKANWLSKLKY